MTATGASTHLESDGKSVPVLLSYTLPKDEVAYVEGMLGITTASGDSGDNINLTRDGREYQFTVPAALAVAKGNIVYVDVTDLTGHKPDDSAYYKAAGSNRIRLFQATMNQDSNNMVTGILLAQGHLS